MTEHEVVVSKIPYLPPQKFSLISSYLFEPLFSIELSKAAAE